MAKFKLFQLTFFLLMLSSTFAQNDIETNKCGNCPCNSPCVPTSPPPPPPSPPPPTPKTPKTNCPPPPYGGGGGGGGHYPPNPPFIYINGPPGNLYPIDYSGSSRSFSIEAIPFLIFSVLGLIITF